MIVEDLTITERILGAQILPMSQVVPISADSAPALALSQTRWPLDLITLPVAFTQSQL